ncbi:ABC transporter substrate binding protein [Desulfococcaceae bacterium HSG8]|nr:ABC transporter substrate binding protein [Desulfococcaceae bacterium HSG8]
MKTIQSDKTIKNVFRYICLLSFFLLAFGTLFSCGKPKTLLNTAAETIRKQFDKPKILLINSNTAVEKYRVAQEEFKKTIPYELREVNLGKSVSHIDVDGLTAYNANFIYCIGGKAYSFANKHFDDKNIVFSSIINWLRLPSLSQRTYGVSNELHARMPLFMFRSIFPNIKKIGVLYSQYYTLQWFEKTREQAGEVGIEIIGETVSDKGQTMRALKKLLPAVDAVWVTSDPMVMPEKKYLYKMLDACDELKIPVFSYHEAFAKYGASLVVSVDNPTIGRQAASIAMGVLSGDEMGDKVQFPAGSYITLNLKKVEAYGVEYNKDALGLVNSIIK